MKNYKKILAVVLGMILCVGLVTVISMSIAAEGAPTLDIGYCNLSFRDNVCIKYAVSADGVESPSKNVKLLIWTSPRSEYTIGTEACALTSSEIQTISGKDHLVFDYEELAAKQMTDVIYARAYTEVGGAAYYSDVKKYSILQYAYSKLGKTGTASSDTELIDLLNDMLRYGASCQKYFDYRTESLATYDFYQVRVNGGMLDDGTDHGLYLTGTKLSLTAPESREGGEEVFASWTNTAGNVVATTATAEITVGASNECYTANYKAVSVQPDESEPDEGDPEEEEPTGKYDLTLNGIDISEYTIVYGNNCSDYTFRAVEYVKDAIFTRTGIELETAPDNAGKGTFDHEIVIGETNREISKTLDADTAGVQFAMLADGGHIAMEGDYFVIAAAAYYFVDTYVNGDGTAVPETVTVCDPIVKEADNYIILIGDGMGVNQTKLFNIMTPSLYTDYSDGEDIFYGYMLPYQGYARTNSLSGVTDSAAAGTALATGYKTVNGYIGKDRNLNDVLSLTEIAASLGKATAVMSTEPQTGATPSSFSAHANNRNYTSDILASQQTLVSRYGTVIKCNYDVYTAFAMRTLEEAIAGTLDTLSKDRDGFFLMYEEAYIDKHCHGNDMTNAFMAMVRFNQAIGLFMEYAFYNPNTFVIITADHETGGLLQNGNGGFYYTYGDHTAQDVPVFAYGKGGELFDGKTVENVQIPKTVAALWGYEITADDNGLYPALKKKND